MDPLEVSSFFKAPVVVDARMSSTTNQAYPRLNFNPYQKFVYALRAKQSQRQYSRLQVFFKFLGSDGNIENQSKLFVNKVKMDKEDDRLLQKKLLLL